MFGYQLTSDMRQFIDEIIRKRRQKQATAKGRAIDCVELEDRILLSASPIAPQAMVNQQNPDMQQAAPLAAKAVAADAHGNHVVVWSGQNQDGSWNVHAQRFNAAGVPQGDQFQVNARASNEEQEATVSMNANGTFVVTWTNKDATTDSADVYAKLYNADGTPKGDELLVNSYTGDDQRNPSVAINSADGFVVTWSSRNQDGDGWGVFGKQFDSSGEAVGSEFQINSNSVGDQMYSRVATDASGNFTVIWQSQNQDGDGWGIFGQQFNSSGNRVGSEFQVNATSAGDQLNPNIAMNAAGNFVVSWSSNDGDGWGVYAQRFNADGTAVGGEFLVNATTTGNQDVSAVAMDDSGAFLITWSSYNQDAPNTWGIYSQAYAEDGTPFGAETRVNTTTEGDQTNASVAFLNSDTYAVVWSGNGVDNDSGVFEAVCDTRLLASENLATVNTVPGPQSDNANTPLVFSTANGNAIQITDPDAYPGVQQVTLAVDHGTLTLAHTDGLTFTTGGNGANTMTFKGTSTDINAALDGLQFLPAADFTGNANLQITTNDLASVLAGGPIVVGNSVAISVSAPPIATESLVNTATADVQQTATTSAKSVASDANGDYVVIWSSQSQDGGWNIYGQRFNSGGSAQGDEFQVNTRTEYEQKDAKVAMRDDGSFAVTWTESDGDAPDTADVYLRTYGTNGNALQDHQVLVNDNHTAGDQMNSSVTINNSGVMVAWTSQNDSGSWDVFARWYDVSGNAQQSEFQVNSTSSSAPIHAQVAMDQWGYVLVVWQSETNGQQDVLGRYGSFCNNDNFDTQEFTVASSTGGNDYNPSLGVCNNTGQFVVSWTSDGQDGSGAGIFAQRFDWCAGRIGQEFQVSTVTAGNQDHSSVTMNDSTGDFLVTWSSYNQDSQDSCDVYSQLYSENGTAYGPATRVNTTTEGSQTDSSAAFLGSPNYVVVWSGNGVGNESGVYSAVCDTTLLKPQNLAPVNTVPGIQTDDANMPLTFSTANGNAIQIADPDVYQTVQQVTLSVDHGTLTLADTDGLTFSDGGNGTGSMTFTGMATDINAALNGLQYLPTTAFVGTDNVQITTNDLAPAFAGGPGIDSSTVAVNVAVHPIAAESLVNTTTDGVQQTAVSRSVASDANGNYVVVWSSQNQDGSWDVLGQRFSADGSAQGDQFQVNTRTEYDQKDAKVAMRDDGTFVVTWTESNGDAAGTADVYLRSYDANGNALQDHEILVNNNTAGDQMYSSVTINNNGIMVSWTSQNDAGTWDVLAKWYDVDGNTLAKSNDADGNPITEFKVNTISSDAPMQSQVAMDPSGYVMVVWQTEINGQQDIYGRYGSFCNGDGWDTGEIVVNQTTNGNQFNPSMGFNAHTGYFVVSWTSDGQDGSGKGIFAQQFDWYGNRIGSEFQVNTVTAGSQDHSSVTMQNSDSGFGEFLITWSNCSQDSEDVYSQFYNANGSAFGPVTRVNTTTDGSQANSSVAFLSPTNYVVVWSGNGVGDDSGVYSSIGDMRLLKSEDLAPVNTVPNTQSDMANTPLVFSTANENAIQITDPDTYPSAYQVTLTVEHGTITLADTDGLTFSAGGNGTSTMTFTGMPDDINTALDGLRYLPTLDFAGTANIRITTNNLASAYLGGARTDTDDVSVNVLSPAPIAAESLVNTTTDGVQQTATTSAKSVASDANGDYVVVWSSQNQDGGWDVYAQRFSEDGSALGDQFQVNTRTGTAQNDAKVAMRDDGTFAVTWTESDGDASGSTDVYLRSYDANGGALQAQEVLVNDNNTAGNQMYSSVTINNNGIAVLWTSQNESGTWDLFGRWYDTDGNAMRSEVQYNWTSSAAPIQSQVGMDPWGYVMAVWQGETNGQQDICGRYTYFCNYDEWTPGQRVGWDSGEFVVNQTTAGNQYNPSLGFKSNDGAFVVSWTSDGQDGSGAGIFAQRFDWCGGRIGSEFQVNSISAGNQDHSSVTVDKDTGNFLITWSSDDQGSSDVYSQLYTVDGMPYGPATRVNTTTEGSQTNSSATFLSSTNYVVVWSGNGVGDDSGVYSSVCDTTLLRPENLAPVNTVPGDQNDNLNTPVIFSTANGNAIQITDSETYATVHQVTLTVDSGTLTLSGTNGLTFTSGSNGTNSMTFTGMTADINAALEGMEYVSTVNFTGTDNLQITTSDLAPALAGGPKTAADTVAINVSTPSTYSGLLGIYYNNLDGTGTPVYRIDPTVNYDWGNQGQPASGVQGYNWSASWQGQVLANDSGTYTFYATGDDGVRLWVNNQLICDGWRNQGPTTYTGQIYLEAGQWYSIRMDYFQGGGGEMAKLEWDAGQLGVREVIPTDHLSCANLLQNENVAPVISVSETQAGSVNAPVVFSSTLGNAITVADADSYQNQPLEVTLSVSDGILTLGTTNGLSFTNGDGFQDTTMTFTGSLSNINAALDGLQFLPTTVNFVGTANLDITVNDQAPFFAGGAKSTTKTVAINMAVPTEFQGLLGTYYNNDYQGVDLAQGKTATQSSDPWGYPASNAVDGNLTDYNHTYYNDGSYQTENSWWQVDLSPGTNTQLNEIKVYNRADGCGERLQNFTISVIDANGNTVWSEVYNQPTSTGQILTFYTGNISGEFVRIQKNDSNFLHLAEVEVFNVVPAVTRIDPTVNFDWGNQGSPAPGITGYNWTASWQGEVKADYTGTYTFYGTADDGVRVWVNGQLLCDGWTYQGATTYSGTINLQAGQSYSIRMDYFQGGWGESAKLEWSCVDGQGNSLLDRQVISSNNLSCADLVQSGNAVSVNVPSDQSAGTNSAVVFSSANGNAITIGNSDLDGTSTSVPVQDGSFESLDVSQGNFQLGGSHGGWNFTDYYNNGSPCSSGVAANFSSYSNPNALDGGHVATIQGQGTIWQDVNFAEAGEYTISFLAAYRPNYSGSNPIAIQLDGVTIATITPDSTDYRGFMATFSTSAGTHRLTFAGLTSGGPDCTSFIDRVAINKTESLVQAQISTTAGTFSLGGINGLVLLGGKGYNDSEVTVVGTVADINAALDGLRFLPDANFNGTVDLTVTTSNLASILSGGPKTATNTVAINFSVPTDYSGLLATYYGNTDLSGTGIQRVDSSIDFTIDNYSGTISPAPGIGGNNWSACWQGKIQATVTGEYTFYATADDGVRLWVNDAYVDGWTYQSGVTYTLKTNLVAGQWYAIRVEYFEGGGDEVAKLEWSATNQAGELVQPRELIPAAQLSHEDTAPANTVPGDQTTDENHDIVFSAANGNAIQVSDLDAIDNYAHSDKIEVTVAVDSGTLSLTHTDGLMPSAGAEGSNTMTFIGSAAEINAALDGLTYTPGYSATGEYIASDNLRITTNDMAPALTGGPQITSSTVHINITAPWAYNGLLATYYNNGNFAGTGEQRPDSTINLSSATGSCPMQGIDSATWSARWLGTITADHSETYTFYTTADGGVRLWVNNVLLVDRLNNTGTDSYSGTIDLVAGQTYSIRMDYLHVSGAAYAKLEWSSASQAREVISSSNLQTADQTPTLIVPAEQDGIEEQSIVFAESSGNAVALTELHYDGSPLTVTLTASRGTLTLSGDNGLTISGANGSNTMTITGSLDNINAALDGLRYSRETGYLGAATITITATNPWAEHGSRSSSSTVQIGAVQTNNPGLVATYYSDTWLGTPVATQIDSNINFNWGDGSSPTTGVGPNNWSARWDGLIEAQETGTYTFYATSNDGCRLWVNNMLLVDNWGAQASATNSGTINLVAGQEYSIRMEYCQFSATGVAKLEWSTPNGVREVVSAGVLTHQNQVPVQYLPTAPSVNQDTALVFSGANAIRVADVDAQSSSLLQVTLTSTNGTLTLSSVGAGGVDIIAGANGSNTMTFTGSLDNINAALNGLTFNPAANYKGGASLRIVTTDLGTQKTADNSLPITVIAVNHAPTVSVPGPATVDEGNVLTFSTAGGNAIVIADRDITDSTNLIVNGSFETTASPVGTGYYSDTYSGAVDGWTTTPFYMTNGNTQPNSSRVVGPGSGVICQNPTTDQTQVAMIQGGGVLSQVVNFATAGNYTINFQSCYRLYGGEHSFMIQVDGKSIGTFTPNSLEFQGYSATFAVTAGTHTVTFRGLNEGGDRSVFIDNVGIVKNDALVQVSLSVDHGTLTLANRNGLTFSNGDGVNDASMTFTGSVADVNAVLDGLEFSPVSNYTGTAHLRVTTNDLGNSGIGGPKTGTNTVAIAVWAVNQAPVNQVPTASQGTYGNQPIVFSSANNNAISISDPDGNNLPAQVTLTVANGSLTLGGTQGLTVVSGNVSGIFTMTITGTITDINAALNGLSYTATSGYVGDDVLGINTNDLCNGGKGVALEADSHVNINVLDGPVVNSTVAGVQQMSWQSPQAVAADANGNYVVVWSSQNQDGDGWGIYARRFNASGNAQGSEFLVNTLKTAGDQMYATVAMNANGSFAITWTDSSGASGSADVYAKLYNADGSVQRDQFLVNTTTANDQMYSSVAMSSSGSFVVTWSSQGQDGDGWGVCGQVFDASGNQIGSEFQVNQTTAGDQMYARAAMDSSGNFAVVWQSKNQDTDGWDIYARRFDSSGNPVSNEFRVNMTTVGDQENANIGMNASGKFVVTWTSVDQDGVNQGIFARQYDADSSIDASSIIQTVSGGGNDVWGNFDQFNYASTEVSGDTTMTATVTSVDNTGTFAKAGVMFRDSLATDAAHAMIYVNPSNLVVFQWRTSDGAWTSDVYSAGDVSGTVTVKLVRTGNEFSGFYSTDGSTWTQVGATQTIVMGQSIQAGLSVSSWNVGALCTAKFANVTINGGTDYHLTDRDIGSPDPAGSYATTGEYQVAGAVDTVYTVTGAGNDIGGNSDQGNYASEAVSGDVTMIARVDSMSNTVFNAKAGVMFRDGTAANASYVMVFTTPGQGIGFQWRSSAGQWFGGVPFVSGNAPMWLKLARTGNDFTGFYSTDGVTWTQIGTVQVAMNNTYQAGLAVSSLNVSARCVARFDNVTVNDSKDLVLNAAALGSPALAGSYSTSEEFQTNTTSSASWDDSSVAVDRRGDFLVTWSSFGQDADGACGIYSQRYNADGTTEGPATRVNTMTEGSQAYSSVTALSPDNYMVVWNGSTADENDGGVFYSQQAPVGLFVSYYNNSNLSGAAAAQNVATDVNFNWGYVSSPAAGVNGENWSASYSGLIRANTSELYTFYATADDGVRVYVNGQLLIDEWHQMEPTTYTGSINMLAGQWYDIVVQYKQDVGYESLKLEWSSPSVAREVIPCTQLAHFNQAPTNDVPTSPSTLEDTPLTFAGAVSVPVQDGSFESSNVGLGHYQYGGSSGGWHFTDWSSDGTSNSASAIVANGSGYNNPDTLDGSQAAAIEGHGTIWQDVNFAEAGDYTISFLATYRNAYNGSNPIAVLVDGVSVGSITPTSNTYQPYQTDSFSVTAGVHRITFAGLNTGGGYRTSFIDQVAISSARSNPIRIGDADSTGDSLATVTLAVDHGALSLHGVDGLTMIAGTGTNDTAMTFQGTLASINAALDGLVFTPTTDFRGQAVLTITSRDEGGMGGPQTTTTQMAINVIGVNHAPVNTVPDPLSNPQSVIEHQTLVFSDATGNAISIYDQDAGDSPVQVTLTATRGTISLSGVDGLTFLNGADGVNDATIVMRGTIDSINEALDGLQFKPDDNSVANVASWNAGLQIATNDLGNCGIGGAMTTTNFVNIAVTAVNDPPVNLVPGTQSAFTQYEMSFSTLTGNAIRITDPDAGDSQVQVTLSVDQGTLSLNPSGALNRLTISTSDGTND